MLNRQQTLEKAKNNSNISVLIVGAGINGIGTFRDLALQGVDVLLVDKADYCSGTSAASSHMVHGGIRYLENGEFRLVREAVEERNRLIQNAPHYVKPLPTTIPIFKWTSGLFNAPLKFLNLLDKPSERGAIVIKLGLMMYDAYTRAQGTVPKHDFAGRKVALQQTPKLNSEIIFAATYYDATMPTPERICIDLLHDAQAANSEALALNYVRVGQADGDSVWLHDELTGDSFAVKPKIVINAAGPWIDFANKEMGAKTRFVGGTKGSHLVLDHPELREAIGEREFFFENADGRITLIYPFLDRVMIGTSDIYIENPSDARCTEEEVDYFLEMVGRVFPTIQVERSHIVFRFAGVRPLPSSDANTTGQISRDHSIRQVEADYLAFPVHCLIGGKWTTFRAFSEKTADLILKQLGLPRQQSTANVPIGGGKDYPIQPDTQQQWLAEQQKRSGLSLERIGNLFDRYGTRAAELVEFIMRQEDDEPLSTLPFFSRSEIEYLLQDEQVVHLDDLILRRSLMGMQGWITAVLLEELAQIAAVSFGWSDEQKETELAHTKKVLHDRHQVVL